jgi:hypothetical protein
MIAGRPPFEGLGVAEVLLKQINEEPPPLPPDSNPGLQKLTLWLLEKRPEDRPANAARVIAEIDRLNLDVANTEQILVSAVKRALPRRSSPEPLDSEATTGDLVEKRALDDGPVPAPTGFEPTVLTMQPLPPLHNTEPVPIVASPLIAPPAPSAQEPLLAPPLLLPVMTPPETTTSKDDVAPRRVVSAIDGPTQLDFRPARPKIDLAKAKSDLIKSVSNADTMPPDEDASHDPQVIDAPSIAERDAFAADTIRLPKIAAPISMSESDTAAAMNGNRLFWWVIILAVACGVVLAAILWKLSLPNGTGTG